MKWSAILTHFTSVHLFVMLKITKKSIRETVPTFRVELTISTLPLSVIFSDTPTYTHCVGVKHTKITHS